MMRQLITDFPKQIQHAIEIGKSAQLQKSSALISNVLVSGLGGSGIGGKIVSQLVEADLQVPMLVNNDYSVPNFVNENTLVIISSYSGNTEETLSAMEQALAKNAQIACVTSGGQVLEKATALGLNHIIIPGGNPPRSQFGYSAVQQLFLLNHYGLISDKPMQDLDGIVAMLNHAQADLELLGDKIAVKCIDKLPVIYAEASYEGVAVRWRQQIDENSKMMCWHHVFPEMNHNELVGWAGADKNIAVLMLRNADDHAKSKVRMDICKGIFAKHTDTIIEIEGKGKNRMERAFYLIHLADWASLRLAEHRNVDPVEIESIDFLKAELAKV